MKEEKQNEHIANEEMKNSLNENELNEVDGGHGTLNYSINSNDRFNSLNRDPRDRRDISHIVAY